VRSASAWHLPIIDFQFIHIDLSFAKEFQAGLDSLLGIVPNGNHVQSSTKRTETHDHE